MNKAADYEAKTETLLTPIIETNNFELVDVEYVKEGSNYYLRAYIDKPGGITIDDCEIVSRALSEELDKDDFIEDAYILEVSSPGLGRPLKKDKDYERHMGEEVDIKLYKAFDEKALEAVDESLAKELKGQKEFSGILCDYDGTIVTVTIEDKPCKIKKADIALIRLAFDF